MKWKAKNIQVGDKNKEGKVDTILRYGYRRISEWAYRSIYC